MTAKEKAKDLISKFYFNTSLTDMEEVEKCALITIDEIIKAGSDVDEYAEFYWQEVKKEIERL